MEVAIEKGTRNYVGSLFGMVYKSVRHISWHGALNGEVRKLVWAGTQVVQPSF